MAYTNTTFPTTIDTPTNPTGSSDTATFDHAGLETFQNNAISAIEAKVGANSSAVTTSHDYKLSEVTGADKAVSKTATQTLTNKTLTAPTITNPTISVPVINVGSDAQGDMYYRDSLGAFVRLPLGANGTFLGSNGTTPAYISSGSFATQSAVQNASYSYAADAGSTDTYAITLSPTPSAYATGQVFYFKANTVNTGAATLNVNGLGAKTIVKGVSTTLADGDIAAGQYCTVIYDGTNFVLQNPTQNTVVLTTPRNGVFQTDITASTVTVTHNLGKIPKRIIINTIAYTSGGSGSTGVGDCNGFWDANGQSVSAKPVSPSSGNFPYTDTTCAIAYAQNPQTVGIISKGTIGNVTSTTFDIVISATVSAFWSGNYSVEA